MWVLFFGLDGDGVGGRDGGAEGEAVAGLQRWRWWWVGRCRCVWRLSTTVEFPKDWMVGEADCDYPFWGARWVVQEG